MNKKYLLLIMCIAIFTTGYTNYNTSNPNDEIKEIARNLAIASANNDMDKMTKLGNDMLRKNAVLKVINVNGNCHETVYTYLGKQESVQYCK